MMDIEAETQLRFANSHAPAGTENGCTYCCKLEGRDSGPYTPEGRMHYCYARDIGLAFQIADDIMDVEVSGTCGKSAQKDAEAGRDICLSWDSTGQNSRRTCWLRKPTNFIVYGSEEPVTRHCQLHHRKDHDDAPDGDIQAPLTPSLWAYGHHRRGAKMVDELIIGVTTKQQSRPCFPI